MKIKNIALAITSAAALATTGSALAATGTATAEVTALPPALAIEEVQPYQMQIERAPGATMPTGEFSLKMWSTNGIAVDPAETVQPGCLKITGDTSKPVRLGVTAYSSLTAPQGAEISFHGNPKFELATSTTDCASAIAGNFDLATIGYVSTAATTSETGELYVAWRYSRPTQAASGFMRMSHWEEGTFTGTVDIQVDYDM